MSDVAAQAKTILRYKDECAVCRHVARWVRTLAERKSREMTFIERLVGDDPEVLRMLSRDLDIWAASVRVRELRHAQCLAEAVRVGNRTNRIPLRAAPKSRRINAF